MNKIRIVCPNCNARGAVDEGLRGRKGRCKKCGTQFLIDAIDDAAAPVNSPEPAPAIPPSAPITASERQEVGFLNNDAFEAMKLEQESRMAIARNDWQSGLRLLDQAINKLESVVDREGRQYLLPTKPAAYSNNAENLAMIYANTGNALSSQGQHAAALESYCKAATIFQNLVRQGQLPVTTLSMLYSGIAGLLNHVERQKMQGDRQAMDPAIARMFGLFADDKGNLRLTNVRELDEALARTYPRFRKQLTGLKLGVEKPSRTAEAERLCDQEGLAALRNKEYGKAARAYCRSLSHNARSPTTWSNLGAVYYLFVQGNMIPHIGTNFVVSIYAFDQTGSISGRLRDAVADLVDAEHLQGLQQCLKEAERCFDHAVELYNKPSIAHYWRAMLYRDTGRIGEARRELASLTGPDVPSEFRQGASDALKALEGLAFESINAGNLPADRAALRIDRLFGNELRELLAVRVRPEKRWWQFWVRG